MSRKDFLGLSVRNPLKPISFRKLSPVVGRDRTVSFYVRRQDVLIWNAFARYATKECGEPINVLVLRAIRYYIANLSPQDEARFKASLKNIVKVDAKEAELWDALASQVLRPGENLNTILNDRSEGALARRLQIQEEIMDYFNLVGDEDGRGS